jgi:hypothetical protein
MNTKRQPVLTILIFAVILLSGCTGQSKVATTPTPQSVPTEVADSTPRITLADNGQTLTFQAGQSLLLFLGEDYNWSLSISDQNVISRVKNIATIRGSQGVFDALKPGTSVLSAVGDPTCLDLKPACAQPSIQFQVTIVVQ